MAKWERRSLQLFAHRAVMYGGPAAQQAVCFTCCKEKAAGTSCLPLCFQRGKKSKSVASGILKKDLGNVRRVSARYSCQQGEVAGFNPQHHAQLLDMDSHLALQILGQHLAFEVELLQTIFQVHHTKVWR